MKLARRFVPLVVVVCLAASGYAQDPCSKDTSYRGCKACGTATSKKGKALNVQKNRGAKATSPKEITVADMRDPANNDTFSPDKRVWVKAFVASVVPGGDKETCNCGRDDLRDVHINIIADPSELYDLSKYVIVEFTPRWEKKFGLDDNDYNALLAKVKGDIEGRWVRFEGWMLYDYFHANQSKSTKPDLPTCPDMGRTIQTRTCVNALEWLGSYSHSLRHSVGYQPISQICRISNRP